MSKDQRPKFQDGSKAALFLELADPDDLGFIGKWGGMGYRIDM